ncbi:ADP-ribosylglycohydrolase family protein [Lactiplantibacillus daowaiensis]|uniref:ADP-ribosylglycohydrolase family protein n=1 Tax=Lactiplantibacillus daowaiensis TaxID=2559918 RepID=A0ABW1RW99_9LACO|nr:ADP-ribosylglycohydrolase family protein [Lactiplantibacillus daowaiensis]
MQAAQMRQILYAGIVGDAFGVPVEFNERDTYRVTTMTGQGTWEQPRGSWSDDTSLTLALMDNLTTDGTYADLFERFQAFMMWGAYTPRDETFDIGKTCAHAIRNRFINQLAPTACGDPSEFANGNGALMRLAPLALVLSDEADITTRLQLTRDYTAMTHRHPRAILGSYLYLECLHAMLSGVPLRTALATVPAQVQAVAEPEVIAEWAHYAPYLTPTISELSRNQIRSTGYVVDTFGAALWCTAKAQTIQEAILLAANLGGDTDTVATIAATWAAVRYPTQTVPTSWQAALVNPARLAAYIEPFVTKFGH